ncbi:MAG: hypothetical protein AAF488_19540 [Planctomycetota bacterium]
MKRADQIEWLLIVGTVVAAGVATSGRTFELAFGAWVAYGAVLLLTQGLIRDLWKMAARRSAARRQPAPEGERLKLRCLCAESSFGLLFGVLGATLFFVGVGGSVELSAAMLTTVGAAVLAFGWFIKNYVLVIRRVEDHSLIDV